MELETKEEFQIHLQINQNQIIINQIIIIINQFQKKVLSLKINKI